MSVFDAATPVTDVELSVFNQSQIDEEVAYGIEADQDLQRSQR